MTKANAPIHSSRAIPEMTVPIIPQTFPPTLIPPPALLHETCVHLL